MPRAPAAKSAPKNGQRSNGTAATAVNNNNNAKTDAGAGRARAKKLEPVASAAPSVPAPVKQVKSVLSSIPEPKVSAATVANAGKTASKGKIAEKPKPKGTAVPERKASLRNARSTATTDNNQSTMDATKEKKVKMTENISEKPSNASRQASNINTATPSSGSTVVTTANNPAVSKKRSNLEAATSSKITTEPSEITVDETAKPAKAPAAEKKKATRKRAATSKSNDADEGTDVKPAKTKKKTVLQNATDTLYTKTEFDLPALNTSNDDGERFNLKISSWNVAGLRSLVKKDGLKFLDYEQPDIFCLQEIKCTVDQLPEEAARINGYHPYWLCMPGGYAGVAIYSKIMPINVEYGIGNKEFDDNGRIITAEYEKFYLVNVYVPNSGRKLVNLEPRMRWEKLFQQHVQNLDAHKAVVICGDMNVSHLEIDLANPKANTRNAGFTKEEREKMSELLALGYVDTFRHLYPDVTGAYSYWTYMANARSRNVGWRLDYFIVSERFVPRVVENCMRSQVLGSDHCPITLFLKL